VNYPFNVISRYTFIIMILELTLPDSENQGLKNIMAFPQIIMTL